MEKWTQDRLRGALLARGTEEEQEAYKYLYRVLLGYCTKSNASSIGEDQVGECVQQTIIKIHRRIACFRWESKVETWSISILNHTVNDLVRSPHNRHESIEHAPADNPIHHNPSPLRIAFGEAFDHCLSQLSERERDAFILCAISGYSLADVAAMRGITQSAVSHAKKRAIFKLQACLTEHDLGPSVD